MVNDSHIPYAFAPYPALSLCRLLTEKTRDAAQYYDEGADGRCSAYDPFNKMSLANDVRASHRYTILPLEFGRCGSCSSAEKEFLTGEELTIQGQTVCNLNDWNAVKLYYVQGIKGVRHLPLPL